MTSLFSFRAKLWQISLPLLALANVAYFLQNILGGIVTLAIFLLLPGHLLLRRIKASPLTIGENLSLSLGLSLSILIIGGLILNSLHFLGLGKPLSTINIFIAFDLITIILLLSVRNTPFSIEIPQINPSLERRLVLIVCTFLPVLTFAGANRLNNGASNILILILMATVAVLFVVLVARPNLSPLYPYAIFTIGLSILFCNSLRGWTITGHDIHHEFSVFQATLQRGLWLKSNAGDPYNACLSITILPTIVAKLTGIAGAYVYKAIFQILFAAFLPTLYYMFRRFASDQKAVLGVFVLMTFPTFTNDLPFLNRQEIAFIFIILLLFVNFLKIPYRPKLALTIIILTSIILSHYSSSYVTLILLLLSPIFYKIFSIRKTNKDSSQFPLLQFRIILVTLLLTFVWNAQITSSTRNLQNTIRDTIINLVGPASEKDQFSYSFFAPPISNEPKRVFQSYASQETGEVKIIQMPQLPITSLGRLLHLDKALSVNFIFHAVLAKILQLLVIAGTILLFIRQRKQTTRSERYLLALSCSCLLALALFTILPQLAVDYDVTRLFQQSLMVLWLPSILFAEKLFFFMRRYALVGAAGLFAFLYLNLSGFIPQLTGGFPPQLPLNNSGVYYDFFYTHTSDINGTQWLAKNRDPKSDLKFDSSAALPLVPFKYGVGLVKSSNKGYLYVDHADTQRHTFRTIINGDFIEYTNASATKNKNLIYASQYAKIYKQ
jgi:uncharacterized membrane protein